MLPATSKVLVAKGAKKTGTFTVPAGLEILLIDGPVALSDLDDLVYKLNSGAGGFSKMAASQLDTRLIMDRTLPPAPPNPMTFSKFRFRSFISGSMLSDYTLTSSIVNGVYDVVTASLTFSPVKKVGLITADTTLLTGSTSLSSLIGKLKVAPLTRLYVIVYG